jgi:hypothetical protein
MANGVRLKGDDRILGNSDFVLDVLKGSEEEKERRYRVKAAGYNLERLARQVAEIFGARAEGLWIPGN